MTLSSCYVLLAALAVLPLVVLCQYDVETTCPESLVREVPDQLAVFDGVCLRFASTPQTYKRARNICQRDGGMRVMPKTEEMDQFIRDYMQKNGWDKAWIGLKMYRQQTVLQWDDDTYVDDDDYSNLEFSLRGEFFFFLPGSCIYSSNVRWGNDLCTGAKHFICQYK